MPATANVFASGIQDVDGILSGVRWASGNLTYSFPTSASSYPAGYSPDNEPNTFGALNVIQQNAVRAILGTYASVANLTFTEATGSAGTLRFALSDAPDTAWAYYPSNDPKGVGGDTWINKSDGIYDNPVLGTYAYMTLIHEIGHALGLKHGHEADNGFPALPSNHDSLEYSVMTYSAYVGDPLTTGYAVEQTSYPQTVMMDDIAAVQYMHGANFNTYSGTTVYSWSPTTGRAFINGVAQTQPAGNHILMTVWDGGGTDTYDFSNYSTNLTVNLAPGAWTTTATAQLSRLDAYTTNTHVAAGNIANALLYNGDVRSLIENATGGSGNDLIVGNQAGNLLKGGLGNDTIDGGAGVDSAIFSGLRAAYTITDLGGGSVRVVGPGGTDTLTNVETLIFDDVTVTWPPAGSQPPTIDVADAGAWHRSPAPLSEFGWAQGWTSPNYQRVLADIDNDSGAFGSIDYVAFGASSVTIALGGTWNNGSGPGSGFRTFAGSSINDLTPAQGYDQTFVRGVDNLGNFGGSGDEVWGQGNAGIIYYVATGQQSVTDDGGQTHFVPQHAFGGLYGEFGHDQGWDSHFNFENVIIAGDAFASILGFGAAGLRVAPQAFAPGASASQAYTAAGTASIGNVSGWDSENDIRTFKNEFGDTIDLNTDGIADFVGMGPDGLQFATGFVDAGGNFQLNPLQTAHINGSGSDFGDAQGWNSSNTIRYIADLNGDGRQDILGFGPAGALVSLGQDPTTHGGEAFGQIYLGIADFGFSQGWLSTTNLPRIIGDVNGDDVMDIVGFGNEFTFTALGSKDGNGTVTWAIDPTLTINDYGANQGWNNGITVRELADVDGDGRAELVFSGGAGTHSWDLV